MSARSESIQQAKRCGQVKAMKIERAKHTDLGELKTLYDQLSSRTSNGHRMETVFAKMSRDSRYHLMAAYDEENNVVGTAMGIVCYDLVGS